MADCDCGGKGDCDVCLDRDYPKPSPEAIEHFETTGCMCAYAAQCAQTEALVASLFSDAEGDRVRLDRMGPDLALVCSCDDCVDYYLRTFPEFHETEGYEDWKRARNAFDAIRDAINPQSDFDDDGADTSHSLNCGCSKCLPAREDRDALASRSIELGRRAWAKSIRETN